MIEYKLVLTNSVSVDIFIPYFLVLQKTCINVLGNVRFLVTKSSVYFTPEMFVREPTQLPMCSIERSFEFC